MIYEANQASSARNHGFYQHVETVSPPNIDAIVLLIRAAVKLVFAALYPSL